MFTLVDIPVKSGSVLAAANFVGKSVRCRTLKPKTALRILCSSSSSSASVFPAQGSEVSNKQRASSAPEQKQGAGTRGRSAKTITRVASLSSPWFSDDVQNGSPKRAQNGAATTRTPNVEVYAKGKWQKLHDSSLSEDEPLPLPMTWPDSEPVSKETIDKMLSCDPEIQEIVKPAKAQVWLAFTGKGVKSPASASTALELVSSVYPSIECLGHIAQAILGSVRKITSRADVQDMDGSKGSSNGPAYGSSSTNGKA